MELRAYWRILRRHWWLPVLLAVLVAAVSLILQRPPPPVYQATLRMTIGVDSDRSLQGVDPVLTSYQASEYIRDDFVEVVHSDEFANDVNRTLNDPNIHIGKDNISGAVEKQRRLMTLSITWPDDRQAKQIADAAERTLATQNAKYFKQLGSQGASVAIIDTPVVTLVAPGVRERFDLPIRVVLALIAGLLIVFLLDYLDDSVRNASEVEGLGLKLMGEIPSGKKPEGRRQSPD